MDKSLDRDAFLAALISMGGNVSRAAESLGVSRAWLNLHLREKFPDLVVFARGLRLQHGSATGRPLKTTPPTERAIRKVWRTCKGNVRAMARTLAVPRTSLRRAIQGLGLK